MLRRAGRTRLVLGVLIVSSVGLMWVDSQSSSANGADGILASARSSVGEVTGPAQQSTTGVTGVVEWFKDQGSRLTGPSDAERLAALERENAELRAQLRTNEYDRARADELDALLRIAGLGRYRTVPARVIAAGSRNGFSRTVTIDAGSMDGIAPNQTVLNGDGLVGRVKTVSSSTSTVILAIDGTSTVGVRLENQQAGFAKGTGGAYDSPLTVDLFSPTAPVETGDRLVTFGSSEGAPYVPGVPVGEVTEVQGLTGALTKRAFVRPFVDFGALDVVGVVVEPPRRDPRMAVLPPVPEPSVATPTLPTPGTPRSPGVTPGPAPTPSSTTADRARLPISGDRSTPTPTGAESGERPLLPATRRPSARTPESGGD